MTSRRRLFSVNGSTGRGGRVEIGVLNKVQERVSYGISTPTKQYEQPRDGQEEHASLLYIQATEQACLALRRATQRIRANIRKSDTVLLSDKSCAILLAETSLVGAQAVARRIYPLLVDVEYHLQVLYGSAAYTLLHQLQTHHQVVSPKDVSSLEEPPSLRGQSSDFVREEEPLPYLAFLTSYPSQRLLHIFPYELADRYRCVPIGAEHGVLTLATSQRLQRETVEHLREVTQRDIFQIRCDIHMIEDVLRHWQRAVAV